MNFPRGGFLRSARAAVARFTRTEAARAATNNTAPAATPYRADAGTNEWATRCDALKLGISWNPNDPSSKRPDAHVALQQRQPRASRFVPSPNTQGEFAKEKGPPCKEDSPRRLSGRVVLPIRRWPAFSPRTSRVARLDRAVGRHFAL